MTINEAIKAAVEPVIPICVPGVYGGNAKEYCTFNYSEHPDMFGNDWPMCMKYLVQIHYFCETEKNPLNTKKQLRQALASSGFTYPSIIVASDDDGQHFVFECEYEDGDV